MKKRIGIIGLGDIAKKVYLPILSRHNDVEIVGLMSRSAATVELIGEQYRIANRYTDLSSLFKQEPEAVFVHTPTETHKDIVIQCLKQGINVYVDKPLSYEISESIEMNRIAEFQDRLLVSVLTVALRRVMSKQKHGCSKREGLAAAWRRSIVPGCRSITRR